MRLAEFFQDKKNNQLSAVRLGYLLWIFGAFFVWAVVSIRTSTLPAVPESVLTLAGILTGGKVVQRFGEN
jgi:hypothetical protein